MPAPDVPPAPPAAPATGHAADLAPLDRALAAVGPHPRLLADAAKFAALRAQIDTDPPTGRLFAEAHRQADEILAQPVAGRVMVGHRLLAASRLVLSRTGVLAMVARLTDDPRYADRAAAELRAVCAFADWNPAHFLDAAEMTLAVALGYDWLYDRLDPPTRDACADALLRLGLEPSLDEAAKRNGWIRGTNNWNQVCHAGTVAGAIALADRAPALARRLIVRAVENVGRIGPAYAPDGAYPEGPMYWGYGTTFHVVLAAALEQFTGGTLGVDALPGFVESAEYLTQMTTPTGGVFCYADCAARPLGEEVARYWLARRTRRPGLLRGLEALAAAGNPGSGGRLNGGRLHVCALLWRDPLLSPPAEPPPLHWRGRGPNPVAVHRTAWGDPRAWFVGLKGGSPGVSHGHMDVGSFVLEADGVRWAVDPGMQDYHSLESAGVDLWNNRQEGQRWRVFRVGSEGHNILRFSGVAQEVAGHAPLVRFGEEPPVAVVDTTGVYAQHAREVRRGVMVLPGNGILIQDEWVAGADFTVTWQMLTRAGEVTPSPAGSYPTVGLRHGTETLTLHVLAPADAQTAVEDVSAPRAAYDAPNPGLKRITLTTQARAGQAGGFRVLARPGSAREDAPMPEHRPLAEWPGGAV